MLLGTNWAPLQGQAENAPASMVGLSRWFTAVVVVLVCRRRIHRWILWCMSSYRMLTQKTETPLGNDAAETLVLTGIEAIEGIEGPRRDAPKKQTKAEKKAAKKVEKKEKMKAL